MGSPQQLTRSSSPWYRTAWERPALFVAGTGSLLVLSVLASLVVWMVLPWVLLGWSPSVVVSGSMRPAVRAGDVVLLRPVDPWAVGADTIVAYDDPGRGRVLHRVVERRANGQYLLKGDANPTADSAAVSPRQIRGAAVLLVPWIGTPSMWLATGDLPAVIVTGAALLACLRLVPYALDLSYDPWASTTRVLPARVLLDMTSPQPDNSSEMGEDHHVALLPPGLEVEVLARLDAVTAAARIRHHDLLETLA